MKKSKYLAFCLTVILALGLVSCGRQQAEQEPQEPKQEVQQVEPATTEPITPEVKPAGTVAAAEPADVKPEEQGEEPGATEPETTPEEKPEESQSAVPVQESKPQETQKPVETVSQEASSGSQQGGGQQVNQDVEDVYDADIAARREAFINGLKDYFDERGYVEGADHPLTYEEALDIVGALNGGSQYQYEGWQQGKPEKQTVDPKDLQQYWPGKTLSEIEDILNHPLTDKEKENTQKLFDILSIPVGEVTYDEDGTMRYTDVNGNMVVEPVDQDILNMTEEEVEEDYNKLMDELRAAIGS